MCPEVIASTFALFLLAILLRILYRVWPNRKKTPSQAVFAQFTLAAVTLEAETIFDQLLLGGVVNLGKEWASVFYTTEFSLISVIGFLWVKYGDF